MNTQELRDWFDGLAAERDSWARRNHLYHDEIERLYRFLIPEGSSVLCLGCGTGHLLAALRPSRGLGIDLSPRMIESARAQHPHLEFRVGDAEALDLQSGDGPFDFVILPGLLGHLTDIQRCLSAVSRSLHARSRVIVTYFNFMWEPALRLAERLGIKTPQHLQNWLDTPDVENLMYLSGMETISKAHRLLLPVHIPLLTGLANRVLSQLPGLSRLCLVRTLVARPQPRADPAVPTVSVVIPARNERGNIRAAIERTPELGAGTEIVFVEGNSNDGTLEEIRQQIQAHPDRRIVLVEQGDGVGKGDAVRKGFDRATGDVLMILDADLTVAPEDLPKFVEALTSGRGDFINGTRLVYPMEDQAMRFLNLLGNKFFAIVFSWLLDQTFKDTLCGTKVLRRSDYLRIARNRGFFGDFDPFGDFDLLFGSAKQHLKIVEIPVRYGNRTYGTTNIDRFRHGWLLLRMCVFAYRKLKIV